MTSKQQKKGQCNVTSNLIVSEPLKDSNGFTWTLASCLGQMMVLAEKMLGERKHEYTFAGVEFCSEGPQVWFPKYEEAENDSHVVVIQLSSRCLTGKPGLAYWQLAHECVHLLSPTGKQNATVLEEGVATRFSEWYLSEKLCTDPLQFLGNDGEKYKRARDAVAKLRPTWHEAIKKLRTKEPMFSDICRSAVENCLPEGEKKTAKFLVEEFSYD